VRVFSGDSAYGQHLRFQFIGACDDLSSNTVVLQVVPDLLAWIEFRRVAGKEEQVEHAIGSANKSGNKPGTMGRVTIDNQEHRPVRLVQQSFQKLDKYRGCKRSLDGHEARLPLSGYRRDQVETKPSPRRLNNRRLAPHRPGGAGVMIGPDTGLIPEIDDGPTLLRFRLDRRILLRKPLLNPDRILLKGPPKRLLRTQPKLIQQAANRGFAQPDAEFPLDQLPHHAARPQSKRKLKLPGIVRRYRVIQTLQLGSVELRPSPPPPMGPKGIPTARPVFGQPSENGADTNTQNLGHHRRRLAFLNRRHTTPTQVRQLIPFQFSGICTFHEGRTAHSEEEVQLIMGRLVIFRNQ